MQNITEHIAANRVDENTGKTISYLMKKYEEETGKTITKFSLIHCLETLRWFCKNKVNLS